MTEDSRKQVPEGGAVRLLGERVLRHSSAYLTGHGIELALTVVRLAILTRLLPQSDYGQLAVLMVYAGFIGMAVRLTTSTGTVLSVFRGGGEEDEEDDDPMLDDDKPQPSNKEQRRILGTGLTMTFVLTAILAGLSAILWEPLDAALADTGELDTIVLATTLGGLQGVWMLSTAIVRYEKRPVTYVLLQLSQVILTLIFAVIFIEAGWGLQGAIAGTVAGFAVAICPAIFVSRHRFTLALDREHAVTVFKRGLPMVPISMSFFLVRNMDIWVISRYVAADDIAIYRVGSRLAALSGAGISALVLAWGPLARGSIRGAMTRDGSLAKAGARLFFYYWLFAVWIAVALSLTRDYLIRFAASDYEGGAYLIPLLGVATLLTSGVVVLHRAGQHKRKRVILSIAGFVMAALIGLICIWLVPEHGLYGTAIAVIAAPIVGMAMLLFAAQRSANPMPLSWVRIISAALLGGAWVALLDLPLEAGVPEWILALIGVLLFPVLLVVTRIVEPEQSKILLGIFRRLLPGRRNRANLTSELEGLADPEFELLDRLVRRREPAASVAKDARLSETELTIQFVELIRELGGPRRVSPIEYQIGAYLLSNDNVNDRDREGHRLAMSSHLGPLELDHLDETINRIRRFSDKRWAALRPQPLG